ncbi:MAG TPA: bifunctional oligoribonuclease/PAP phosphatase NrnA [Tissierellaceae bacterium]
MNKIDFTEAINIIKKHDNIFIASHVNPDGDNIGSCLGLYLALKKTNKNVRVLQSDILPEDFNFLKGFEDIKSYEDDEKIDLLILLDSADSKRLGDNEALLGKAKTTINIDHHLSNTNYADLNLVDPKSPSTCELVYYLIKQMNIEIDKNIAEALYTGISTDTGKFSYDSVTGDTLRIVANLIDLGIDFNKINIRLYESISLPKMSLKIKALSGLKMYKNNQVALVKVSQDMLKSTNTSMEDTNGIVEEIRKVEGVEVACLLKEIKKNEIKVSMRSKEFFNVSEVCEDLGGGGHIRASGCTINKSLNKSEQIVLDTIDKYLR